MSNRLFQVLNRKLLVNFRVCQEEHDLLLDAANRSGCRSLSEFVRVAVLRAAGEIQVSAVEWKAGKSAVPLSSEQQRLIQQIKISASPTNMDRAVDSGEALPVDSSNQEGLLVDRILTVFEDALRSARVARY